MMGGDVDIGIRQVCRGYGDPHVGMGIEISSPRQPWTLPWIWGSIPTAAAAAVQCMLLLYGVGMGIQVPSPRQTWILVQKKCGGGLGTETGHAWMEGDGDKIYRSLVATFAFALCLQCFDAVGWAAGRASGL